MDIKLYGVNKELIEKYIEKNSINNVKINFDDFDALAQGFEDDSCKTFEFIKEFNQNIYALKNVTLSEELLLQLKQRALKICVAESLTGGNICNQIVRVSGASDVLIEGLCCYANESKVQRLGVAQNTINAFGAVSYQVAKEMCLGLLKQDNCNFAISTTGIAGPTGGSDKKPVGLAYIGVGYSDKLQKHESVIKVYEEIFDGDRDLIRKRVTSKAIFYAIQMLTDKEVFSEKVNLY